MKKLISLVIAVMMTATAFISVTPVYSVSADPADSYEVQTAPYEDPDIQMWFQHANVKVHQEDTQSTGRNTYSVYMAKNEYQGTQVTLYSPSVTKSNISANISEFTAMNGSGATMSADVYYEYYINCVNLDSTDVLGVNSAEESFIREGMIPDAMAKIEEINASKRVKNPETGKMEVVATKQFTLTAGLTQTLYIKIKSELDTPSGWYSAQFNVLDSADGNAIKTATVYAYVWDFEIPEANHYQTAFHINRGDYNSLIPDDLYANYYDYLLDNRICAFVLPGELNSSNEYLTNPRVTAFSVSAPGSYLSYTDSANAGAVYEDLSAMDEWDEIKDKAYFYIADEPRSQQQKSTGAVQGSPTISDCISRSQIVNSGWPDANILVVVDENHPYPAGYSTTLAYDSATGTYLTADDGTGRFSDVSDAIQGLIDSDAVNLWCIKSMMMTPRSVTQAVGFNGIGRVNKVRNMNGIISGFDCTNVAALYFDWDSIYGPFSERFAAYQADRLQNGKEIKMWWYECGKGPDYTYCNHLIENTGLQTELLFWQSMQVGATGYLYYGVTYWSEAGKPMAYAAGSGNSYNGSTVEEKWAPNRQQNPDAPGTYRYGNGVLMYGKDVKTSIMIDNKDEPLGTIRVEHIRDGIEDYEMLYQYREKYGQAAMDTLINKVTANVVDY
ncbi:MAG: DUF4091 domain-containing protein, partial [Clostridia bacterium]|nr:DUF4091 domain-containing protein [Clostridia bacterium]